MITIDKNYKYLRYTNLLLLLSIFYFIINITYSTPVIEYIFASSLILTITFSQLFWNNPIKKSFIHKIDAIIAKIVIITFIAYTLIYKFKFSFLLILLAIAISFYFSNYYSNKEWCCNKHVFFHALVHIFCFIATFYTFFPTLK
jgi:hypothetical protein